MSEEYKPIGQYPDGSMTITAGKGELAFGYSRDKDNNPILSVCVNPKPKQVGDVADIENFETYRLLDIKFLTIESVQSLESMLNKIKLHLDELD